MPGDAEALLSKIDGVKGSAIFKKDGNIVASKLPSGVDEKELSKTALAMLDSAKKYIDNAGGSQLSYAIAGGPEGFVATTEGSGFVLVCITGPESDTDSISSKIRKAAEGLKELA
ncbi:MAG: roadblock/LC7 domain-containing protein [Candidatus Micrarchaeota archaeon]